MIVTYTERFSGLEIEEFISVASLSRLIPLGERCMVTLSQKQNHSASKYNTGK